MSDSCFKTRKSHTNFEGFSSLLFWCSDRGTTFDTPWRGLGTNVLLWGILGQKVSWKNMADDSPMSPLRKRGVFCLFGWKNLHGCDICKSTGKRNPFTTVSYNNLQKLALERHQNSKDHILSITDLKLRKSFQATVSNAKKNIDNQTPRKLQGGILISLKQYILWLRTTFAADNFIPLIGTSGCERL